MTTPENCKNSVKLVISMSSVQELERYRNALLAVLRRVNINSCEPEFKADLKIVYRLITKMGIQKPLDDSAFNGVKQKDEVLIVG